jgi:hypothetical protein
MLFADYGEDRFVRKIAMMYKAQRLKYLIGISNAINVTGLHG